jgi:SAM-dependent methyltransferase
MDTPVVTAGNYIIRLMFRWFRSALPPYQTPLAMLGAKAGQQVVFLDAADPGLAAEVARITGLNGRTLVAVRDTEARRTVESAAAEAGVLVELTDAGQATEREATGAYDLAVITADWIELRSDQRRKLVDEAFRVARPGGRIVLVLSAGKPAWPVRARPVPRELADEARSMLTGTGCRAVRVLGVVPGTTYVEGVKPRTTADT